MVPESGGQSPPVTWLTSVVLLVPSGPIRAWISPCFTSIETLSVREQAAEALGQPVGDEQRLRQAVAPSSEAMPPLA